MEKIDQILDSLYDKVIEPCEAKQQILDIFNNTWTDVGSEIPPKDTNILVKSPDGFVCFATWRPGYEIFSCQNKYEKTFGWQWKLV